MVLTQAGGDFSGGPRCIVSLEFSLEVQAQASATETRVGQPALRSNIPVGIGPVKGRTGRREGRERREGRKGYCEAVQHAETLGILFPQESSLTV